MKREKSLAEVMTDSFRGRRYEPVKRLHADFYGHHGHRFPIKGGITFAEVMVGELYDCSPVLRALIERGSENVNEGQT